MNQFLLVCLAGNKDILFILLYVITKNAVHDLLCLLIKWIMSHSLKNSGLEQCVCFLGYLLRDMLY